MWSSFKLNYRKHVYIMRRPINRSWTGNKIRSRAINLNLGPRDNICKIDNILFCESFNKNVHGKEIFQDI